MAISPLRPRNDAETTRVKPRQMKGTASLLFEETWKGRWTWLFDQSCFGNTWYYFLSKAGEPWEKMQNISVLV